MQQPEERTRLHDELEEAKDKARRRSIGNIKFIGELFKLKMLTEAIMHDCVVKLLKNHDEESLECLCRLLTTIGKDLDFEKAKVKTPNPRNLQQGLCQLQKKETVSSSVPISPAVSAFCLSSFILLTVSVGPSCFYHIFSKVRREEGPKLCKSQFTNGSEYLSLVLFLHDYLTYHFVCIGRVSWQKFWREKLLRARTENEKEMKKTQ